MLFCITAKSIGERYKWVIHDRGWQGQRPKHVRFAPKADKQADVSLSPLCARTGREHMQQTMCATRLLDHLVGVLQKRLRDSEAERFRRLEVDDQLELRRELDRQIAWLGALEDAIDIPRRAPVGVGQTNAVRKKAATAREHTVRIDRRQAMQRRQRDDEIAMGYADGARHNDQGALRTRECIDDALDLGRVAHAGAGQLYPECRRGGLDGLQVCRL